MLDECRRSGDALGEFSPGPLRHTRLRLVLFSRVRLRGSSAPVVVIVNSCAVFDTPATMKKKAKQKQNQPSARHEQGSTKRGANPLEGLPACEKGKIKGKRTESSDGPRHIQQTSVGPTIRKGDDPAERRKTHYPGKIINPSRLEYEVP